MPKSPPTSALDYIPSKLDCKSLKLAAGSLRPKLMFVGEQPGDREDLAGRPFVGRAGQLFDKALAQANTDRSQAYVTNGVKHFKYKPAFGGERRLHERQRPVRLRHASRGWTQSLPF